MERARNHSGNDDIVYVLHCETFEHQQLVKPHGIFVGCPPGVCGNPPARANLTAFHQGKNDGGVSCVYGKQHDLFLRSEKYRRHECHGWSHKTSEGLTRRPAQGLLPSPRERFPLAGKQYATLKRVRWVWGSEG